MNKKLLVFSVITVLLMSVIPKVSAEEALTLEKALSFAYKNNPRMVDALKAVDWAKGELITSRSLSNPEAEFEISGLKKNEEGERDPHLGGFEVRQGFDLPVILGVNGRISKHQVSAQEESIKIVWQQVYGEIRQAYTHVILDKKTQELASEKLNIMRQFYSQVQQQFQSGKALKNDLQRAKLELLNAENETLAVEKEIKADKAKLNILLGRAMETPFEIEEELKDEELVLDLNELIQTALSRSPLIKNQEFILASKESNLSKEQLKRLPSPFVGFKRTNEDYDNDYAAVVGFSVPLWNLNQGEVKKARAEKEAQAVKVEAVKREASFGAFEAYLNAELAHRQFELQKKSLEEANELFHLANLKYSEGEINFLSYLDQVKAATETRVRYYEGLFNLTKAITELEKSVYMSVRQEGYLK
jgi:cobalt-zinc-cadmium efflux system outer membrane protein